MLPPRSRSTPTLMTPLSRWAMRPRAVPERTLLAGKAERHRDNRRRQNQNGPERIHRLHHYNL